MFRRTLTVFVCTLASASQAGGHFDVDDAGTLDPGRCQYEIWAGRFGEDKVTDYHFGPACRVGPVELGLSIDRYAVSGEHAYVTGPQVKWTFLGQDPDARLAAAISATMAFDVTRGGHTGGQLVIPVSWRALDSLWIHANLGADWATDSGERSGRGGLQAEWAVNDAVSMIFERFRAFGVWTSRGGLRYSVNPSISIDLSASRSGSQGVWGYAIGLNHEFRGF